MQAATSFRLSPTPIKLASTPPILDLTMPTNKAAWIAAPNARPLEVREAPYPSPGPRDIIIQTAAVAINPLDYKIQDSNPPVAGKPIRYPTILGADLAGTVIEVGSEVKHRTIGQRVIANADGISRGQSAGSAFQMSAHGSAVLIWGGSSSVGCCAIQLANAAGYEVYTTASRRNEALCKSIGAARVFDHSSPSVEKDIVEALGGKEVVGALDCIADGEKTIAACARILAEVGGVKKVVAVLAPPGLDLRGMLTKFLVSIPALKGSRTHAEVHAWMSRALADGSLQCKPDPYVIGEGLESVQAGIDMVRNGVSATKVVVRLSSA
ncbi:GroES-like protein [Teratosphaeria nubilosa]|uniref:GroES-like protein n=1 Tax=Teratosphaeria nubilosa TaxID=161662 RepID=A0A6G1L7B9_9PEZI|nr:GroES-like protein [Teratosphaeria nubilosa]